MEAESGTLANTGGSVSGWKTGGGEDRNRTLTCENECIGIYLSLSSPTNEVISHYFDSTLLSSHSSLQISQGFNSSSAITSNSANATGIYFSLAQTRFTGGWAIVWVCVLFFFFFHSLALLIISFISRRIFLLHTMLLVFPSTPLEDQPVFLSKICRSVILYKLVSAFVNIFWVLN